MFLDIILLDLSEAAVTKIKKVNVSKLMLNLSHTSVVKSKFWTTDRQYKVLKGFSYKDIHIFCRTRRCNRRATVSFPCRVIILCRTTNTTAHYCNDYIHITTYYNFEGSSHLTQKKGLTIQR